MRQRIPRFLGRRWDSAVVILIVLAAVWFRLTAYGDLRLSIATLDTQSYMDASRAQIFSWQAFITERLFTTNVLYRLAGAANCQIQAMSVPAIGKESHRRDQACFAAIVLTQTLLSVVGWGLFIFAFATAMIDRFTRIASAATLSVFAFVPQIADWDSILNSQSLAFSLFALALGFVLLVIHRLQPNGAERNPSRSTQAFAVGCLVSLALWSLVRDPNVYPVLLFCLMALVIVLLSRPRAKAAMIGLVCLLAVCVVGLVSSMQSGRWKVPLSGAYGDFVLSDPARVQELQKLGMPDPASAEFQSWFDQHGASSYALLLLSHPRFVAATVFDNLNYLFSDNNQPYFKTPDLPLRNFALQVGDWVHARSSAVILAALLTLLGLVFAGIRTRSRDILMWAWFLGWLLISGLSTAVLTFIADPAGVERHVLFSLVLLRLLMWMGLLVLMDLLAARRTEAGGV
jgi:hypothetical protein